MEKSASQLQKCINIFLTFFRIGAFTIGGGYAMLPLIERDVVQGRSWLTEEQFLDTVAVSQSLPGVLAINMGVYVGYRVAGWPGSLAGALGASLPSFMIILVIASFYNRFRDLEKVHAFFRGAQPAVVAVLFSAAYNLGKRAFSQWSQLTLGAAGLVAILVFDLHPILMIAFAAFVGAFLFRPRAQRDQGGDSHGSL